MICRLCGTVHQDLTLKIWRHSPDSTIINFEKYGLILHVDSSQCDKFVKNIVWRTFRTCDTQEWFGKYKELTACK